ncbi:MAG: TIGR02757 family protein [Salinivirgaceae bacterium]|nr:TIGR02757 family protein [Salinivirgaceae bacterium]
MKLKTNDIKKLLDQKVLEFSNQAYINSDPIQIPHQYSAIPNIEISAFLTAQLAWGNRKAIIKSAGALMSLMENNPHEWILNGEKRDFETLNKFVYRTFNATDLQFYVLQLQNILKKHSSLGAYFQHLYTNANGNIKEMLGNFHLQFMQDAPQRSRKHLANVNKGSAAKRLNMFLRWMVRSDQKEIDFGLWDFIPQSQLYIPLDVHSGRVARKLGLLERKVDDWKSVEILTDKLREFDAEDPIKYDFALFGLGVFEKF